MCILEELQRQMIRNAMNESTANTTRRIFNLREINSGNGNPSRDKIKYVTK